MRPAFRTVLRRDSYEAGTREGHTPQQPVNRDDVNEELNLRVLEQSEQRRTCPVCLAGLLLMVAAGLVGDGADARTDVPH